MGLRWPATPGRCGWLLPSSSLQNAAGADHGHRWYRSSLHASRAPLQECEVKGPTTFVFKRSRIALDYLLTLRLMLTSTSILSELNILGDKIFGLSTMTPYRSAEPIRGATISEMQRTKCNTAFQTSYLA